MIVTDSDGGSVVCVFEDCWVSVDDCSCIDPSIDSSFTASIPSMEQQTIWPLCLLRLRDEALFRIVDLLFLCLPPPEKMSAVAAAAWLVLSFFLLFGSE